MRANEFLAELFDPVHASPLKWAKGTGITNAYGGINIGGHDVGIDITFHDMGHATVNIEFSVNGEYELTGKGGAKQVFATVIEAVRKFVSEHPKVTTITFTAEEQSRARMYDTLTKRVAHQLGWHVVPFDDLQADPKYGTLRSYGAFSFAIEKGKAPEHRQPAQKPQHGKWITTYYVYSREDEKNLPHIKVKATSSWEAERYVMKTVPEYKDADPMGVFVTKEHIPNAQDIGSVPPPKPKPAPRVLNPLEQKLKDKLGA